MRVVYHKQVAKSALPKGSKAETHLLCLEIQDIRKYAVNLINQVSDDSWINGLQPIGRASYSHTANRTIEALVEIFQAVDNSVTEEFGEYMVSISATEGLSLCLSHRAFPIAELWKEKVLGNHGFDFHTECLNEIISFGEAKYNKRNNPYSNAATQVLEFIQDGKDFGDSVHLIHFASQSAIKNLIENRCRGFIIAFSMNSQNHESILENALQTNLVQDIGKQCHRLYIVGVRACVQET